MSGTQGSRLFQLSLRYKFIERRLLSLSALGLKAVDVQMYAWGVKGGIKTGCEGILSSGDLRSLK